MPRSTEAAAYDSWADHYDLTTADTGPFVDFYAGLVDDRTRSVLELGCGTGSILAAVAERLRPVPGDAMPRVVGMDGSDGMLAVARKRVTPVPVEWVHGDLRTPPVAGTFDLVYCCFNTYQHLLEDADLLQAFRAAARLVAPGGTFAFDIYQPNLDYLRVPQRDRMARAVTAPDGRRLEIREDTDYEESTGTLHVRWRLVEAGHAAEGDLARTSYRLRQYPAASVRRLLGEAGFAIDGVFGEYDRSPFTPASRKQIYACSVAGA